MTTNFRQYLELKYLEWQREIGGRKTVIEFANYLGVSQQVLSSWWNKDRVPQGENIQKLANKLGLEVYDVLGLKRPNAMLYYITKHWDDLPETIQEEILNKAESYVKHANQTTPVKRKAPKT